MTSRPALVRDLVGQRVPIVGSATGLALTSRPAQRLVRRRRSLRYALADAIEASTGLLVPMTFHGRAVGVLAAFDRQGEDAEFSREDERMMQGFAASARRALATAQDVAAEGFAAASLRPSRSALTGRASSTTRRCRASR